MKSTSVITIILGTVFLITLILIFRSYAQDDSFIAPISTRFLITNNPSRFLSTESEFDNEHTRKLFESFAKSEGLCLNGKKPGSLSPKDQLLEFIKGPCAPVVIVPGLFASRLTVTIDCETLQSKSPEVFETCGWDTCSSLEFWKRKPKEFYNLWISDLTSPMSLIWNSTVACWGKLIHLDFDPEETDITKKFSSPPGVNVSVYGEDAFTKNDQDCGFSAINNLLPSFFQDKMTRGFFDLTSKLESLGYQKGLTLYASPFDWRKTTLANEIGEKLDRTVEQIYNLTSKASVIVAHSLGNFGALYYLNHLPSEKKDKYIANYVAMMGPLAGAPKSTKIAVGGDYEFVWHEWGISFYGQKEIISGEESIIDLQPKDTFTRFQHEKWMKEWNARNSLENSLNITTEEGRSAWKEIEQTGNYTIKWFPTPLNNCSTEFLQRDDFCALNMYNWSAIPVATILNRTFTISKQDLGDLFLNFVDTIPPDDYEQFVEDSNTNKIHLLQNPEVPVTLIYGSHLATEKAFHWDYDPINHTSMNLFAIPNRTEVTPGDGTVPVTSALLPGIKWTWEFDNKEEAKISRAKPVKVVEYCSELNNKEFLYDEQDADGVNRMSKNEYVGLRCDCMSGDDKKGDGWDCSHPVAVSDTRFIELVASLVQTNQRIEVEKTGAYALNPMELSLVSRACPAVNAGLTMFERILISRKLIDT